MRFSCSWHPFLAVGLAVVFISSCSVDPNVHKQKYFQSGQNYFEKGKYSEAAVEFMNAIKIDPGYADAHFQLGESYLHLQQTSRAYQELSRYVELRPDDYKARIELANLQVQSHDYQHAQEQADILLKKRPEDPAVHALASSLLAAQEKIPGAIAEMQRAIALGPNLWEPYLSLALLQLKNKDFYAAEVSFKKVIELDPKAMQPRLVLGNYFQSQKRFEEAEKQYREALTLDAKTIEPRKALAGLYLAEGKKSDAEDVLLRAKRDLPHNADSFLALSNFYYVTGNLDKSVSEYHALYQEQPKDPQVKKKYIQLLIQANRYDEARSLNDEILKANPKDADALVFRSQMQISGGDINDAAQTLQTVVKDSPDNSQAHYTLGVALQKQGNLEHAVSEWRETLRLDPNSLEAEQNIADAAMRQGDMEALQQAASQMIRLQPGAADGYALRAVSHINRKQYAEAELDIQRAIGADQKSALGYVQMGNLRYIQRRYVEAAQAFQQALDRNPSSIDALRGLVGTFNKQNQVDKAIATARLQIGKVPPNSKFYNLLGDLLFNSKRDLAGAEAALQKSVELDKHNLAAVLELCQVRAAMGKIDQAIAMVEQALKDDPRQPALYLLMGTFYESKGNWKSAQDAYQNALTFNSQNPSASNNLARVMLHTGENFDMALSLAQTARKGLPDSPGVADTLGWIYYRKGLYPMAINYLQEALKLQEKNKLVGNPDIDYHLGWAYEKTAQPALARKHFEQVLKINPNYPAAAEIKTELSHLKS